MKHTKKQKTYKLIEFILLFFCIPLLIYFDSKLIHPSIIIIPILFLLFAYFKRQADFTFKELIVWNISKKDILKHALILLAVFTILLWGVLIFVPEKLFNLPRNNVLVWILLSIFYPLFSAFGQEIIYRTFIFRRYKDLFPSPTAIIIASAVTFSFVHIVYYHPVSILLTLIAGAYLAIVYNKTKSVLFTAILHGIMGNIVFAVGLGEYFWLDIHKYL